MALKIKNLAAVALTGTEASIYTAMSTTALIKSIRVTNTTAVARTVTLKVRAPGPDDRIIAAGISVAANTTVGPDTASISIPGEITLTSGYELRAVADNTGLECVVSGFERS